MPEPAQARRTQEERSAETRGRLLDATTRLLSDAGYGATTTRRVSELSGISQGAQSYHFARRVDLVVAAVERIAEQRIAELRALAGDLPEDPRERAAVLLDVIWADFSSDEFAVFVKLWVAAAEDAELHARLVPVERVMTEALGALADELGGGELQRAPDWHWRIRLTLAACRGIALAEAFEPRARRRRDPWPELRRLLLDVLVPMETERPT